MHVSEFQRKWSQPPAHVTERQAAQEHFTDLCRLFAFPTPNESHSPDYAFERGAQKLTGGRGFADVWKRGAWAWEYKRPGEDLDKAYQQLKLYADALENPPLLVVSDLVRFRVFTNFTGTPTDRHEFSVDDLSDTDRLNLLRLVFHEPLKLRPGQTKEDVTKEAAAQFGAIAAGIEARGIAPDVAAHALMQMLFCLFAEDVGILPAGLFTDLLRLGSKRPEAFASQATTLFTAMSAGGVFGTHEVSHVNGGLFARVDVPDLAAAELAALHQTAQLDWGAIEPSIFGTLFERSLDPAKRSQLGLHYTGWHDIERVVEPVVMTPLRRRWDEVRAQADEAKAAWDAAGPRTRAAARARFESILDDFRGELASVRVLDPASGSCNFLYITLAKLLDLERAVSAYGALNGLPFALPRVRPSQMLGLEINTTARELGQVAVWIGYLQWMIEHGHGWGEPVLEPLETIRLQDALLDLSDPDNPKEAEWPEADYIVGNPPFLGGKRIRAELGDEYTRALHRVFSDRLPPFSDLVCYFFEKAREAIDSGRSERAGMLATNSIRGGANRRVLERIKESGDIFLGWADEPWILEGAAVRISIVGFDAGAPTQRTLDGEPVSAINADLTSLTSLSGTGRLLENSGLSFIGVQVYGDFDIPESTARSWIDLPHNPNGHSNSDVLRPYFNAADIVRRWGGRWIVDFGADMPQEAAALYEAPFQHVREHVRPMRIANREPLLGKTWWLHWRPRQEMRAAVAGLSRFLATPAVSKHRLFVWLDSHALPTHAVVVFARQDDYFFGVLHSRAHELWSLRMGTWLGIGNDPRYTPTTCFETFPLPWKPGSEPWRDERVHAIASAARELDELRNAWLNPPDATEAQLKKRTLTNLYNERPAWLANAHAALDRAVWTAYGWDDSDPAAVPDDAILARLLALNLARASGTQESSA